MSFRGLEVASIQRSRKHRPVCALLAMVFGFGCSTPKSSSVAVPGPAKAEPAKVGAVAPIDVVETTRAAPPAGVLQKSLDEDAPYQELERLIGQAREPVWVTVGDTGVLLTPNLPEFWPKEPVLSADHQIGVLAFLFEADGRVTALAYAVNARGRTVRRGDDIARLGPEEEPTTDSAFVADLRRLCGDTLKSGRRVDVRSSRGTSAARVVDVIAALERTCPDGARLVELGGSSGGFEFHALFADEQRDRFVDIIPPVWVSSYPLNGMSLLPAPRHFIHDPPYQAMIWRPPSSELTDSVPRPTPSANGIPCEGEHCPSDATKQLAIRMIRAAERGVEVGTWSARSISFPDCEEPIPQTRIRRLVLDQRGRVRALFVEQQRGLSDAAEAWYYDEGGALRVAYVAERWPKAPNPAVHAHEGFVYFQPGRWAAIAREDAYYGEAPFPEEDSSWLSTPKRATDARRLYESPPECVMLREWQGGMAEEVGFTLVFGTSKPSGSSASRSTPALSVQRLPKSLRPAIEILQTMQRQVLSGTWAERRRMGCPSPLISSSWGWSAVALVVDDRGQPRAVGTSWFGPHSNTEERTYYDDAGRPRLEWVYVVRDSGERTHFFRLLDDAGGTLATERVVERSGEGPYPTTTHDFDAPPESDPLKAYSRRWYCNP